jgi:hypothetical protein
MNLFPSITIPPITPEPSGTFPDTISISSCTNYGAYNVTVTGVFSFSSSLLKRRQLAKLLPVYPLFKQITSGGIAASHSFINHIQKAHNMCFLFNDDLQESYGCVSLSAAIASMVLLSSSTESLNALLKVIGIPLAVVREVL